MSISRVTLQANPGAQLQWEFSWAWEKEKQKKIYIRSFRTRRYPHKFRILNESETHPSFTSWILWQIGASLKKIKSLISTLKKVLNHPLHSYLDQEYRNLSRDFKPRYIWQSSPIVIIHFITGNKKDRLNFLFYSSFCIVLLFFAISFKNLHNIFMLTTLKFSYIPFLPQNISHLFCRFALVFASVLPVYINTSAVLLCVRIIWSYSSWITRGHLVSLHCLALTIATAKIWHLEPFHSQEYNSDSPYCLAYNSHDVRSENLVLDRLIIP